MTGAAEKLFERATLSSLLSAVAAATKKDHVFESRAKSSRTNIESAQKE